MAPNRLTILVNEADSPSRRLTKQKTRLAKMKLTTRRASNFWKVVSSIVVVKYLTTTRIKLETIVALAHLLTLFTDVN